MGMGYPTKGVTEQKPIHVDHILSFNYIHYYLFPDEQNKDFILINQNPRITLVLETRNKLF